MSTTKKPGNEPDAGDMVFEEDPAARARSTAPTDSEPTEEEAARLGDFA
jgi:hypothetical protein